MLDGDAAGRARRDALMKELYSEDEKAVLMLGDVLNIEECEIEDVLGEDVLIPAAKSVLGDCRGILAKTLIPKAVIFVLFYP